MQQFSDRTEYRYMYGQVSIIMITALSQSQMNFDRNNNFFERAPLLHVF